MGSLEYIFQMGVCGLTIANLGVNNEVSQNGLDWILLFYVINWHTFLILARIRSQFLLASKYTPYKVYALLCPQFCGVRATQVPFSNLFTLRSGWGR